MCVLELVCLCSSRKECCGCIDTHYGILFLPFADLLELSVNLVLIYIVVFQTETWAGHFIVILVLNLVPILLKLTGFIPLICNKNSLILRKIYSRCRGLALVFVAWIVAGQIGFSAYMIQDTASYNDLSLGFCSFCLNVTECSSHYDYYYPRQEFADWVALGGLDQLDTELALANSQAQVELTAEEAAAQAEATEEA